MIMSQWPGAASGDPTKGTYEWELREQHSSAPACAEDLVDGKLALNVSMTEAEKEPLHTGKWSQEEVSLERVLLHSNLTPPATAAANSDFPL